MHPEREMGYHSRMSDPFLDHLPSQEREKIRKRLRSPEAYEALRDKVKGPEDLERELRRSEQLAELQFSLETEPHMRGALREQMREDIQEKGIDAILEADALSPEGKGAIEQGKFDVRVDAHPQSHEDAIIAVPEGNVQEKAPVKTVFSDRYVGQFVKRV
ncbi:MAG: hypothetical protein G01um101425_870 [Candidatus Peregrinibacteria bacterium Gr01-1014_25]|nr:MAG: hypothetical protein G01um101425_870 [Candidatus Peregrinibacteria bacterium Gr01-1014_25]